MRERTQDHFLLPEPGRGGGGLEETGERVGRRRREVGGRSARDHVVPTRSAAGRTAGRPAVPRAAVPQ